MERGVYAQGWHAREHNYHPSLPGRRLKMVEDFAEYRATMTTWPGLGGGVISLPYLEAEAFGVVPARYRQYGFLKDSEFLDECRAAGVKAFSVIFSTQGWEFPAELNEAEDEILAMNELRGVGVRTTLGLREFTQNRYPKIWAPFEKYFPDGLVNSSGEKVTDLFEECASRDIHGNALHADWLEVPGNPQECHYMDINNPVWREYLKAIVRIHVDAGVDGIQFDEPDSPISALKYGGCFCTDCMTGFTEYLRTTSAEVSGDFHYGRWLLAQGRDRVDPRDPDALAVHYVRYLQWRVAVNFRELADYVREYAASRGRTVLVSSNLYDGSAWTDPMADAVDILVPEQRHTLYSQPGWMRYIAAFAGGKPITLSVNPYGGVIPELVTAMNRGRSFDRYRVMMYEAAALGANLAVPYGAWMGSVIEDAMWAPHEETVEIQGFLADHDGLFGTATPHDVAVVFSVDSSVVPQAFRGAVQAQIDPVTRRRGQVAAPLPFFAAADSIGRSARPFDVVVFHDGVLRTDDASHAALAGYSRVIIPGDSSLTARQAQALAVYLDGGGRVTVTVDPSAHTWDRSLAPIVASPGTRIVDSFDAAMLAPEPAQVVLDPAVSAASALHVTAAGGVALHLVNYGWDDAADATAVVTGLRVTVRGPAVGARVVLHAPGRPAQEIAVTDGSFVIPEFECYAIVEL